MFNRYESTTNQFNIMYTNVKLFNAKTFNLKERSMRVKNIAKVKFYCMVGAFLIVIGLTTYFLTAKEFMPSMIAAAGVLQFIKALGIARFEVRWKNSVLRAVFNN